ASDEFFVVRAGVFGFKHKDEEKILSKCSKGGSFGEMSLILGATRMVSAVALAPSQVYVLNRITYRKVIAFSENERLMVIRKSLKSCNLLQSLSAEQIADLADCVQLVKFNPGDPIIIKGS